MLIPHISSADLKTRPDQVVATINKLIDKVNKQNK